MSKAVAWSDAVVSEPVTLINAFTVSPAESEPFLRRWKNNAQIMARQPGFIRARMHRSLVDDTQFQYINVAEWDSGKALDQALANPEWRANVQTFLDDPDLHFTSLPVVYQVTVDVHPGDRL
jgi:heme-degrading monooxygenase HmoA